ncbi:MAG: hypothetical protein WBG90_05105 [Saonia sp.]
MIASFMTHWPKEMPEQMAGKPTYFVEKILSSFPEGCLSVEFLENLRSFTLEKFTAIPKLHTIREDKSDRWKVGRNIHFYINSRKPNMFLFAPVIPCISVQKIKIIHSGEKWRPPWVLIDGIIQLAYEVETLAKNDGFDSLQDFFSYFNTDFTGKIIHWTNLKY